MLCYRDTSAQNASDVEGARASRHGPWMDLFDAQVRRAPRTAAAVKDAMPIAFETLQAALPLAGNGKLDRAALPTPETAGAGANTPSSRAPDRIMPIVRDFDWSSECRT